MIKRLELIAQKICVSGTPNNKAWKRRILSAGGKMTTKVVQSTTLLIKGPGWSTQEDIANGRGIPVLNENEAELLLKQGFIDLEFPDEATHSLDELIGDIRAALDGPPSSDTWNVIIDQIDRCAPEQLEPLVNYLGPILSTWKLDPDARWSPSQTPEPPRDWVTAIPHGELRVTPHHWIATMTRGTSSPAYSLLRHLHFEDMKLNATAAAKVLSLEHLTNLHTFDMGGRNTYAPSLWKKIATLPSTSKIKHFGMGEFRTKHLAVLPDIKSWHPFETLTLTYYFSKYDDEALAAFLSSPACARVKMLRMLDSPERIIELLNSHDAMLPELERITIKDNGFFPLLIQRVHALKRDVESMLVECDVYMYSKSELIDAFSKPYPHIKELDLSGARVHERSANFLRREFAEHHPTLTMTEKMQLQFHADLLELFPESVLAKSLERVKLGRWWSEELAHAIEAHGTHVIA